MQFSSIVEWKRRLYLLIPPDQYTKSDPPFLRLNPKIFFLYYRVLSVLVLYFFQKKIVSRLAVLRGFIQNTIASYHNN